MVERPIPPDNYSAADRGLWRIKLELAKERTAAFMAKKLEEARRQAEVLAEDRRGQNPKR